MKKYIYSIAITLLFITFCTSASASTTEKANVSTSTHSLLTDKKHNVNTPKKKYKNKHVRKSRARKFGSWY